MPSAVTQSLIDDYEYLDFDEIEMAYPEPKYSRNTVDAAGLSIIDETVSSEVYDHSLQVINNWRASHNLPLLCLRLGLERLAKKVDPSPLIAQRIKRLAAIKLKLSLPRRDRFDLSEMQDIGGCRAIVKNINAVKELDRQYELSRASHLLDKRDDYIEHPKKSGYRGIHLIFRFQSGKHKTHNGLKIEIQLRTPLQHAWATAVETVGLFTGQALKSGLGSEDWKRFFALMGSVIAMREDAQIVPKTPKNREDLVQELHSYASKLDAQNKLKTYSAMLTIDKNLKNSHYFIIELNPSAKKVNVTGFTKEHLAAASEYLSKAERNIDSNSDAVGDQAVMVSVKSIGSLRRAYPNYFLDMRVFIKEVDKALSG